MSRFLTLTATALLAALALAGAAPATPPRYEARGGVLRVEGVSAGSPVV
jgi:hypothetical protein